MNVQKHSKSYADVSSEMIIRGEKFLIYRIRGLWLIVVFVTTY